MRSPGRGYAPDVYVHDAYGSREDARLGSGRCCVKVQAQRNHAGQNK